MPMDGLTTGFAARELNETLTSGRIDKITQPERDTVVLVIRAGGANHRLLLCASPNNARCHLTTGTWSNPLEPPALCMLMRKQLTGARITEIRQVGFAADQHDFLKPAGLFIAEPGHLFPRADAAADSRRALISLGSRFFVLPGE